MTGCDCRPRRPSGPRRCTGTVVAAEGYSRQMARTDRRAVIGLLMEKQVTYTEVETDALVAEAKRLAKESGRTVRAEAQLLLTRDRVSRVRDLRNNVVRARELLGSIILEVDDLWGESGDDEGELADILATMAACCEPFTSHPRGASTSTTMPGRSRASSAADVAPMPAERGEGAPS